MPKGLITRTKNMGGYPWMAQPINTFTDVLRAGAKLDAAAFPFEGAVRVTVGAGGAAIGATAVPVTALVGTIPVGTVLDFGGAKFARLTVAAAAGATSLTVTALTTALVVGDIAVYGAAGRVFVPSGTYVGRMRADEKWAPATATHEETFLTEVDVFNALDENDVSLVTQPGFMFYRQELPGYAALVTAVRDRLERQYIGIDWSGE